MMQDRYNKGLVILSERVASLLKDGYHVIVNYKAKDLCMVKLRHHNGNRIVIKYNYPEGWISQTTNNVPNYSEKVC